jgi:uncharacterized protein
MVNHYEEKLIEIVKKEDWLICAFRNVRDLRLPDSYIAAGAIRNTIWNHFHNFPSTFCLKDIDVVYFDSLDMDGDREIVAENLLYSANPHLKWEVVNQARAHLFMHGPNVKRPKVESSSESISYWSETPTCVGVRLEEDESFTVCAPHGLNDLMNLIVRPVPAPFQELPLYTQRIIEKNWGYFWPKLKIVHI